MLLRLFVFFIFLFFCGPAHAADAGVKGPNVAGAFYPADAASLSSDVDRYIASAPPVAAAGDIGVAIAPHAGYVFSGPVAGHTYKSLAGHPYTTIVVIGPSHFYPFNGVALWPGSGMQTPLGTIPVDEVFAHALQQATPVVSARPEVFTKEHAVEVQLPFLQRTFPAAKIVPLLMGNPDFSVCEKLAVALNALIGQRTDVLVLISSDMAHYRAAAENDAEDSRTFDALQHEDISAFWNGNVQGAMEMCGFVPVTVGMMLAKLRGLHPTILGHANSGDASGDNSRVVGYGAVIYAKPAAMALTPEERSYLLSLARRTVTSFVQKGTREEVQTNEPRLTQVQGAFVTLTKKGELRGCIGNIIGQKPLAVTVRDMAIEAASQDPRFQPVTANELPDLNVEISVLSPPQRVADASAIVLGRDGVIVSDGGDHQGVFLPQVATETGWGREQFLAELCSQKAGLRADCWKDPAVSLFTFTAEVFGEK